jgi:hypothetical protein
MGNYILANLAISLESPAHAEGGGLVFLETRVTYE